MSPAPALLPSSMKPLREPEGGVGDDMMRSKFWEHKGSVKSRKFTQPGESLIARLFCFASLRLYLVAAAQGELGDRGQRRNAEPRRPRG